MTRNNNKIYRIWDTVNNVYITLGADHKSSWLVFPSAVLKAANLTGTCAEAALEVHEFKLEPSWRYNLKHELIHD